MRVACVQMCSGNEVTANLQIVSRLLEQVAADGASLALLPENFSFMGRGDAARHLVAEELVPGTVLPFLAEAATRHSMHIIGGTVLLPGEAGRLRNASPVFGPDGSCLAIYDKMHLFDVELPGETHRESDSVQAGGQPV
jgi:predicted amidohydrolase